MISSARIQDCYIDLYKNLRNYLWDIKSVEHIVDLELCCFQALPDLLQVSQCLENLNKDCARVCKDDDGLRRSFDSFYTSLEEGAECPYCRLDQTQEVV